MEESIIMEEVTGTLKNWKRVGQVIYGDIYGDTKGRFVDGTNVRTSRIEEIVGNTVYTANSIYELED